ncbi:hypothetical protein SVIOM342S_06558 [Streptomyces violaceorubidus]
MPMSPPRGAADGPVLMNWAVSPGPPTRERTSRTPTGTARCPPDSFLHHFADLAFDWLDVPALVRSAQEAYVYPMVDRDPLPRWTHGSVTLLGDAAHAMYPMGSNGATRSVMTPGYWPGNWPWPALRRVPWPPTRRNGCPLTRIQDGARRSGPEVVIDMAHERAPGGFADPRHLRGRQTPGRVGRVRPDRRLRPGDRQHRPSLAVAGTAGGNR